MNSNFFESIDKETQSTNQSSIWTKYEPSMVLGNKIYEGMLLKASKSSGSALDMRYFILQENYLIYKQTEESSTISSALKIKYAQIKFPTEEELESTHSKSVGNNFAIKICSRGKYSVLFARNQEEYQIWMAQLSKAMFRIDFHTKYQVTKAIGQGAFANVYEAISRANPEQKFAVKGFNKSVLESQPREKQSLWNEITILRQLDHPNLLRLHEVHETENSIYIVFDLVSGGELTQLLDPKSVVPESDLLAIFFGLARGLAHLADKGIVHRDLKPANILLKKKTALTPYDVVIVDFGLATYADASEHIFKRCGTPGYIAPEIISSANPEHDFKVTTSCDVFSLGVIIYSLIQGDCPFHSEDGKIEDTLAANLKCLFSLSSQRTSKYDPKIQLLLSIITKSDPTHRPTMSQVTQNLLFVNFKELPQEHKPKSSLNKLQHHNSPSSMTHMWTGAEKTDRKWSIEEQISVLHKGTDAVTISSGGGVSGLHKKLHGRGSGLSNFGKISTYGLSLNSSPKVSAKKDKTESGSSLSKNLSSSGKQDSSKLVLPGVGQYKSPISKFCPQDKRLAAQLNLPYLRQNSRPGSVARKSSGTDQGL